MSVPFFTISSQRIWYSSSEPSHQKTLSGRQSAAILSTHNISALLFVFRFPDTSIAIFRFALSYSPFTHLGLRAANLMTCDDIESSRALTFLSTLPGRRTVPAYSGPLIILSRGKLHFPQEQHPLVQATSPHTASIVFAQRDFESRHS